MPSLIILRGGRQGDEMKNIGVISIVLGVALAFPAYDLGAQSDRKNRKSNSVKKADWEQQTPWSVGVSPVRQRQALEKFQQGNISLADSRYREALLVFQEALQLWDHPAIHFNIAVCLINLDRPIEAYDHLARGMEYGEEPLGKAVHAQGETYKKLLDGSVAKLTVRTKQTGVVISLDGKDVFTGPGEKEILVSPGSHQLVAKKNSLLPLTKKLEMRGGESVDENIHLIPFNATPTKQVRRWKPWVPWAVAGSGAAVGLIGVGLQGLASSDFSAYDKAISSDCPGGCMNDEIRSSVRSIRKRAELERGIGIGALVTGGVAVAAGITMVIMNQPKAVVESRPQVVPTFTRDGAGVSLSMPF